MNTFRRFISLISEKKIQFRKDRGSRQTVNLLAIRCFYSWYHFYSTRELTTELTVRISCRRDVSKI